MDDPYEDWDDYYAYYCPDDERVEEDDYYGYDPPPLGYLSLGPVTVLCPLLEYDYSYATLPDHLSRLTLEQGEELVEFLVSVERICDDHEDCRCLTRDVLHDELATLAERRGDHAMAARHRARMSTWDLPDEVFEGLLAQLTAAE